MDEPQTGQPSIWMIAIIGFLVFGFVAWLVQKPFGRLIAAWRAHHNHPEAVAARKLRSACAANDASTAYAALMAWLAVRQAAEGPDRIELFLDMEQHRPLREHWQALSRHLFASETATTTWHGTQLWARVFPNATPTESKIEGESFCCSSRTQSHRHVVSSSGGAKYRGSYVSVTATSCNILSRRENRDRQVVHVNSECSRQHPDLQDCPAGTPRK